MDEVAIVHRDFAKSPKKRLFEWNDEGGSTHSFDDDNERSIVFELIEQDEHDEQIEQNNTQVNQIEEQQDEHSLADFPLSAHSLSKNDQIQSPQESLCLDQHSTIQAQIQFLNEKFNHFHELVKRQQPIPTLTVQQVLQQASHCKEPQQIVQLAV